LQKKSKPYPKNQPEQKKIASFQNLFAPKTSGKEIYSKKKHIFLK
jgi:hypothetical protein